MQGMSMLLCVTKSKGIDYPQSNSLQSGRAGYVDSVKDYATKGALDKNNRRSLVVCSAYKIELLAVR